MLQDMVKRKHRGPPYNPWIEERRYISVFLTPALYFIKFHQSPTDTEFLRQTFLWTSTLVN